MKKYILLVVGIVSLMTLFPLQSSTPASPPTPAPPVILLTKRDGSSFQLSSLRWEIPGLYASHEFFDPLGVPTASGVEVSLDYVTQVEFGVHSDKSWPVTITLLDGTLLKDELGFKARRLGLQVEGGTDLGSFKTALTDVQAIVLQRETTSKTVPDTPPSFRNVVVIENRNGTRTKVSGLRFHTTCVHGPMCCYGDDYYAIPLVSGGINVDFAKVKVVEVGEATAYKPVPVTITTVDDKVINDEIRTSYACSNMIWRLKGSAALGFFEIELDTVRKIESETSPSQLSTPSTPSTSRPLGTLIPRKGTALEFTNLYVPESGGLPLTSGLLVQLSKVKEVAFGEESGGLVPVTITAINGKVITDTMDGSVLLEGDIDLGTFNLRAKDIKKIEFETSPSQLPTPSPPSTSGPSRTLIPRKGAALEFTNLRVPKSDGLPLKSGLTVQLSKVREVAFGEESDGWVPVTITAINGKVITDAMDGSVLLEVDIDLGTFNLRAKDIKQIVLQR